MSDTSTCKYPEVEVQLTGEDGNGFSIVGRVRLALRSHGVPTDEIEAYTAEATSGDYDALLATTLSWVSAS